MRRVYFSPITETMPMNPASVLCASGDASTPYSVDNTPQDGLIIS